MINTKEAKPERMVTMDNKSKLLNFPSISHGTMPE